MKKIWACLFGLLLIPAAAMALSQSNIPPKFPIPWGNSAGSSYIRSIPTPSQIGIQNCAASLTDGFPPLTFTPSIAGGCPPDGRDFNGILKQLSQWGQWQSAGGPVFYDSAFASAIGGYPKGAKVSSAVALGDVWMSIADNNTTNPDAGGANWVQDPGQVPIGTPMQAQSSTVSFGYVAANGLTIGNASSNATGFADASTQFLFAYEWANCASCAIFTSAGSSTTKGASAALDFAANKAIATPNMKGLGLMGVDTMGGSASTFLSGVPVASGNTTTPGSVVGENLHQLSIAELPTVTPSIGVTFNYNFNSNGGAGASQGQVTAITSAGGGIGVAAVVTATPFGSGTSHNIVERSSLVFWNLKL